MAWKQARRAGEGERIDGERRRGRGAVSNAAGRFEPERRENFDDGWESLGCLEPFKTEVREECAKAIIAYNESPDIGSMVRCLNASKSEPAGKRIRSE